MTTLNNDELRRAIEPITSKYRDFLGQFLESDNDDFTGMHTTRGIPEDSFYSQDLEKDLAILFAKLIAAHDQQLLEAILEGAVYGLTSYTDTRQADVARGGFIQGEIVPVEHIKSVFNKEGE